MCNIELGTLYCELDIIDYSFLIIKCDVSQCFPCAKEATHVIGATTCYKLYIATAVSLDIYAYHICMSKVLHKLILIEKLVVIS